MFLIGIVFIIREMFTNKKRTKIIEEILEVCIKELIYQLDISLMPMIHLNIFQ
jgi:hypothetical protein